MFGKLLNNYYYGKSGKGDYRRDDLPRNRWQLFREMLRVRLSGLFRLNVTTAVLFLPMAYVLMVMSNALFSHLIALSDAMAAGTPEAQAFLQESPQAIYSIVFSGFLLLIPAIAITGPAQAGMAYVTRNWARDEHAFVWSDFKDAVKGNWKQALGVSFITGLWPIVALVCFQFYGGMAQGNPLFILPQMLVLVLCLVWMLALAFLYPMMVTYKMGFWTLLRNSLLLAVGRLPHAAGARLLMLVPLLVTALVSWFTPFWMYALMALGGYYLLIGNALARFVYASVANAVFDRFINARIEGAQVDRGLAPPEDDADEAQETGGDARQ